MLLIAINEGSEGFGTPVAHFHTSQARPLNASPTQVSPECFQPQPIPLPLSLSLPCLQCPIPLVSK